MEDPMARKRAWSPAEGPPAAPQQIPARSGRVSGSGEDDRRGGLWAPSEGPVRCDPGGAGGEPDGRTVVRPGRTALDA
jgi:hypothetical protein